MKTVGVVIDAWKLHIFKKHIDAAGFTYSEQPGITNGTHLIRVKCEWIAELKTTIEAANQECADARRHAMH